MVCRIEIRRFKWSAGLRLGDSKGLGLIFRDPTGQGFRSES